MSSVPLALGLTMCILLGADSTMAVGNRMVYVLLIGIYCAEILSYDFNVSSCAFYKSTLTGYNYLYAIL